MLYLIGLGLNPRGITKEGILAVDKCKKLYLESYTVNFPYDVKELKLGKDVIPLKRSDVESNMLIKESRGRNIALLVYGSPLFATTHLTLLRDAKDQKVKTKVIYSSSVFDAISETGLQLYKFGKITSMPKWQKNFTPDSFMDIVKENLSINAHSLILSDIDLSYKNALKELETASKSKKIKLNKFLVCSNLGSLDHDLVKIYYDSLENLKTLSLSFPFCFIIPGELHFLEKESLENFSL